MEENTIHTIDPDFQRGESERGSCEHCDYSREKRKGGWRRIVFWSFIVAGIVLLVMMSATVLGGIWLYRHAPGFAEMMRNNWLNIEQKKELKSLYNESANMIAEDEATVSVVESVTPAVVSIVVSKDISIYRDNFFGDPFGFFNPFGFPDQTQPSKKEKQKIGGGSGFFISDDGMIITNKHVVSDENAEYAVLLADGSEHMAKVLARDPVRDFALIKIDGSGFPTLQLGDSDAIKVGQTVIAIGNSLGEFSNSVSRGIVSGLKRDLVAGSGFGQSERLTNIIQTDAAINPGNSGGPLLDIRGQVIGINTAVAQGAENVGFALPINSIKKSIEQVKKTGKITAAFLGVRYALIDEMIQDDNNLPFSYGALVVRGQNMTDLAVIPDSPADKAGIVEGDIILEVNGVKVDGNKNGLSELLSGYSAGESISLKVWHKGSVRDVFVALETRKKQ